jgi:peroxiredoxin
MHKGSTGGIAIGEVVPDFELTDTDGVGHSLAPPEDAPAQVVIFTCNHCPYALAWHERLMEAGRDYAGRGVRFFAINPNDAGRYPDDSFAAMQARVREEDWPMPYLHDETQEVARAFMAQTTPDVFVVDADRRLRYRGAPDAAYDDPGQGAAWLRQALDDVLAGREPRRAQTDPVGCSVKWKG